VIARPLPPEDDIPRLRIGTRAGRSAVPARRARTRRRRYATLNRTLLIVGVVTLCVFVYLFLMANVTRMNYELTHLSQTKAHLLEATARNDTKIANLESRESLMKMAARLGMHQPQTFAEIALPAQLDPPIAHGIAFLDWLK